MKVHTPDEVIDSLKKYDGSGDQDFLAHLFDIIRRYPEWELLVVNPAEHFNIGDGCPNEEVIQEYIDLGPSSAPPIIAVPGNDGKHDLLDGMHRANAAAEAGVTIRAYVPLGSLTVYSR